MCGPTAVTVWVLVMVLMMGAGVGGLPSCPRSCSCPQPSELHCTFRSLLTIPSGISKNVERINLGFNAIHTLTETSLAGLSRLELLMIHGNNIHELPHRAFTDLTSLQMLKMSYNKLVELDRDMLHGLWSLARLHLDHNRLAFIHPDAFQGLTALRLLQLDGNRLQTLHPHTFCTFSLLGGHLHASTLRHLHLSDNGLTTLQPPLLATMPRLENLYLQGNPWTCDCRMRWFHHWESVLSPGVLKCKKDRAYSGGQLCPLCSSPRHLRNKELHAAAAEESMVCSGPVIIRSSGQRSAATAAVDDTEVMASEEFREPLGNVTLSLSDEHGNQVDLACGVGEPPDFARVDWEQQASAAAGEPSRPFFAANVSLSVELDCPVDRDSYELLWRLIAYYSDVPAHLRRDGDTGTGAVRYRQDAERDALYYTGVRANVAGLPAWLEQEAVDLQLDRPQSTARSARLLLRTRFSQTVEAELARRQRRAWVAIDATNATRTALTAVLGGAAEMDCQVRSSEPAVVRWMLPDGSRVRAPSGDTDRVSVSDEGRLAISAVGHSDSGVYYCMAAVHGDLAVLPFRLAVEESSSPPPTDEEESPPPPPPVQGFVGERVTLPCAASGSPDADIHWVLPGGDVVSFGANSSSSRAAVFSNGTLRIQRGQPSDIGYYKCVAVNQHGADALATRVTLSRRAGAPAAARPLRRPPQSAAGVNTKVKVPTRDLEEEEASGDEDASEEAEAPAGKQRAGVRGGHPSRTMWRRPAAPRRPAPQAPSDRRNAVVETRRRIGVQNNKIDPAKWADILAKIRDKTAQSNATTTTTTAASPTATTAEERRGDGGAGGRRAPSRSNVEGSSEVDGSEADATTQTPTATERHGDKDSGAHGKPVTPSDARRRTHGRTHASRGKQQSQGTRRKTANAARDNTAPDSAASASSPPPPSPTSVPQSAATDWQTSAFGTSSSSSSTQQQRQHTVTAADGVTTTTTTTTTSDSSRPGESSVSSSGKHGGVSVLGGSRLDSPPTTDEPRATTGARDKSDEYVTEAEREDAGRYDDDDRTSQALLPSSTTMVSPTTMPARRLSGKKGNRGGNRLRPPNSRRKGNGNGGGGRRKQKQKQKQRPDRRKQRPDRPGRFTTTPAEEEEEATATAPTRLKIEPRGTQSTAANVNNSAVPFTGGQATSSAPLSHTASHTAVSGHGDRAGTEPPTTPTPSPASSLLPPLTKHSPLPPAKPLPRSTSVAPLFPTTSPGGETAAPNSASASGGIGGATTSLAGGIPTPPPFTSAPPPLPPPVKPSEETRRRGSVPGDPGPTPRSDEQPAETSSSSSDRVQPTRVQPDVGQQSNAATEAAGKGPLEESNTQLFPSADPAVQREINRPSSDWITTKTTAAAAAAGGLNEEQDALETTETPVVSKSSPPRSGEGRTAHAPSDGDELFKETVPTSGSVKSTTPAAAESSPPPLLPSGGMMPWLHAAAPSATPTGGRQTASTGAVTREGPKFNQIPDSHSERAQRPPEGRIPLGGDPLVVISSRPESPDRAAAHPVTHSDGQNTVVVRGTTTKPPAPKSSTGANTQAVKQTTAVRLSPSADASRGGHPLLLPGTAYTASTRGRPRITNTGGRTVTVNAEADARLPCEAVGEPMPFLSWTKVSTGASVAQNTRVQRFEVHPNGTLVIRAAQPADRGQYLCMVQNQYGSDKALVTLAVLSQHPRVLQPRHRDLTVPLGGAADLECTVTGHPAPRVTWVLPDRVHLSVSPPVIPPHRRVALFNNGTLRISQASYADRGVYKCIGSSPVGADTASVRLHVTLLPPVIQQGAHGNATLPEGGAAYLHCSARGAPTPTVRWTTPGGLQLAPSQFATGSDDNNNSNFLVFPNGTLYVRGLTAASAGRYECTASSALASSRRTVTLTVVKGPSSAPHPSSSSSSVSSTKARIVSSSPQRTDVVYGGTVQLDCLATGRPEPRIIWRTPSKKLVDSQYSFDPRIKVFANGTLTVRAATEADGGDYLCVARNKVGDDYVLLRAGVLTRAARIERKRLPSSSSSPSNAFGGQQEVVAYGGDLKVDCVASGLPDPQISWALPDGTMVNPAKQQAEDDPARAGSAGRSRRYVVFDNGTLYLNEVGMREEGDYTCYAQNQLGKDEMRVRVRVKAAAAEAAASAAIEPPRIRGDRSQRVVVRVPYGEAATLDCSAEGRPAPLVSWTSPTNRAIAPAASDKYQVLPSGTLVVHKAQRFDGGNYTCSARNAAGTDRRVITLEVLVTPPTIIGGGTDDSIVITVNAVVDRRQTVDCEAAGSPAPRLMWVLPENVILPAPYYGARMTVHRNGTLDIRAPKLTDSGRLVCVARNEGGEARFTVRLDVREEVRAHPGRAGSTDVSLPLTVGSAMTLNCSFEGGGPPRGHVTWLLPDGTPLLSGARFSKFFHRPTDGALVIGNPSVAESGVYRCLGRGGGGTGVLLERAVTLSPGRKPHISNRYDAPVSVMIGEDLLLHCVSDGGGGSLRLTWTLPSGVVLGRPQRAGRYAVLANGTLSVRQASAYDRGPYACRAANEYGGALLSAAVAVLAFPPRIASGPPAAVYARRGVAVQLNCVVAAGAAPRAEVAWETPDRQRLVAAAGGQPRLFGNKYLHPQGSLVIQNPAQRDAGLYRCTARNAAGVDSRSTYLNVF